MRAFDLMKIDAEGNPLEGDPDWDRSQRLVNTAGFLIHSAVHMARDDAHFVVHTHTRDGMAVAAQRNGPLPLSQHAMKFFGHLAYHDYEGIALDEAERVRLVRDLSTHNAMILRNHGIPVRGHSAAEAYDELYYLERACSAQITAQPGGVTQFRRGGNDIARDMVWKSAPRLVDGDKPDDRS